MAQMAFPRAHRKQLHSTNPLERFNAEIKPALMSWVFFLAIRRSGDH